MEWTQITSKTLIPQIPSIIEKNNAYIQAYMNLYYDGSRGVLIKPLETTGRVKAGNGEFVNMVVDNLSVKSQYTNLYDNITTADYDFYKTTSSAAFQTRDASLTATPYENPTYKYIDVNKPYYKITNTNRIAFKSDNLSQVVHVMFDTSTNSGNDFIIQLNPHTNEELNITVTDAFSTWIELIMSSYDSSWGGYWELYRYGTLDASSFSGGGDASYGTVSLGDPTQIPYVNGAGNDLAYSSHLVWDNTRLIVTSTKGTNNIYIGENSGNASSTRTGTIGIGFEAGKSLTSGIGGTFIGYQAGKANTTAIGNTFVGYRTGLSNIIGSNNTYLGTNAGYSATGINNVFIGKDAGYYETDSNILFIDNQSRSSKTLSKAKSLIYGQFNADPASQIIRFNSQVELPQIDASVKDNVVYYDVSTNRLSYGVQSGGDVSIMSYGNGIIKYDASIEFGGALLRNTELTYNIDKTTISFNDDSGNFEVEAYNGIDKVNILLSSGNVESAEIELSVDNETDNYSKINLTYDNIILDYKDPSTGSGGLIIDGSGIKLSKNFATSYGPRSVVDKEYVDIVAGGGLEVSLGSAMQIAFMNDFSTGFAYDPNFTWDKSRLNISDDNNNVLIGKETGGDELFNENNVFVGSGAGKENDGSGNVFIGRNAGLNVLGSNKLIIHNNNLGSNELSERGSLIYGEFSPDTSTQIIRFNSQVELTQLLPVMQDHILYWDTDDGKIYYGPAPTGTISMGEHKQIPYVNDTSSNFNYTNGFTYDPSPSTLTIIGNITSDTIIVTDIDANTYDNIIYYDPLTGEFGYGENVPTVNYNNGLSLIDSSISTNVELGGYLIQDTAIDLSTYVLSLSGGVSFISDISTNNFKFNDGSASEGYFMTSDSSGNASWAEIPTSVDISIGSSTQIPYSNIAGTNFEYSNNITFDNSTLTIDGSIDTGTIFIADYQYMGKENVDNSWRFYISNDASADLIFEKRINGVWKESARLVVED